MLLERLKPSCSHSTHLLQTAILYSAKIWCTWLKAIQSPQLRVATTSHGFTDLMHLSHPPQELQRHSSCEQGMITQPVRGLQELHTSPSYPDPLTTPQAQPLPSARTSPQRVLIRLKSILPPSYTPLFPQQNPHPSPLVLKYSNALSTEYSQRLIWTIVFLLPVLSSNFVFSHSTSSDAWAL